MEFADTLTTLLRHHLWANLLLLESCAALTPEQLAASIPGSYGSIYVTWQHIVRGEQSYYSRISTGQRLNRPDDEPDMTFTQMADSLRHTGTGLIEWSAQVKAEDTAAVKWEDGSTRDVPKAILYVQVINHATEHREQIKATMTDIGIEPPDLQGWAYFEHLWGRDNTV